MRFTVLLLSLLLVMPLAVADGSDEPEGEPDRSPGAGPPDQAPQRRDQGSSGPGDGHDSDTNRSGDEPPRSGNGNGNSGGPQDDRGDTNATDDRSGPGNGTGQGNSHGNGNGTGSGRDTDDPDDRDEDADDEEADEQDDDRDDRPASNRGRRVHDDERGFRTMPDQAQAKRPAVSFQTDRASTSVEQAGVSTMEMQVESVLEYRDEDGDGAYDLAEPVLQRFPLRDILPVINASADDVRDVRYAFPPGGAVTLRFHMDGAGDEGAKFDVILDDFPFAATDTRVAVAVQVEVPGGLRFAQVAGQPALAGVAGERVPYISWVRNVTVDGVDQPVVASAHVSVDPQQATGLLFWSYPQGASIVHDPILGVTLIPVFTLANPSAYAVAALAGIAALAVGFEARRRFRP